jgi:formate dehydrogenase subunit beta
VELDRCIPVENGQPVGALQAFLAACWERWGLAALLAPAAGSDGEPAALRLIRDPAGLAAVDPFVPLMCENAAGALAAGARPNSARPDGRTAVLLRACELRAVVELRKRGRAPAGVILVGIDCAGTVVPERDAVAATEARAAQTAARLATAAAGRPTPDALRTACRLCEHPAPEGADVAIGFFGVDPAACLLVGARDRDTAARLALDELAPRRAGPGARAHRLAVLAAIAARRGAVRTPLLSGTGSLLGDPGTLLAQFARCSLCGDCLDACPLYGGELEGLLGAGGTGAAGRSLLAALVDISRWVAGCSGCGLCEQSCPAGIPLTALMIALSRRVDAQLGYTPGDPEQALPWIRAARTGVALPAGSATDASAD